MKTRMHVPAGSLLAGAAALLFTAAFAVGQTTDPQEAAEAEQMNALPSAQAIDRVSDHFVTFAGGETNAMALVTGLVNGTAINLTSTANGQTSTTTITPPTGTMGAGAAFTALALAEAQLTGLGDTQPTAADIEAALIGGKVTVGSGSTAVTTTLQGVLVLQHQGQTFSQIAQTLGVNLQTATAAARAATDSGETAETGQPGEMAKPAINARVTDKIADHFVTFAGSEANATALVNGLRDGTAINLTSTVNGQTVTTTFTPTTSQMGYGNVFLSLALAEEQLTKLGDTQPTAADIEAALNGGKVTVGTGSTAVTTTLTGVLVLRNQGQGFGQIAQTLGVNLQTAVANARASTDAAETAEAGQVEEMAKTVGSARVTDRLADRFATFAGSETNATALVNGLHNGTAVTLTAVVNGQTVTTTITPTTGQMGYGNVFLSLALAEEKLTMLGVSQPTAAEIQAALEGGSVTTGSGSTAVTTTLQGVLVLRSQGQSFSQIAQTLGVNLQTAIADARAGTDANEAAENEAHWSHTPEADTAKTMATTTTAHTDVAGVAHTNIPSMPSRPDVSVAARPDIPTRPQIPTRPEIPVHPEIPIIHH